MKTVVHVLVVDDDASDRALAAVLIARHFSSARFHVEEIDGAVAFARAVGGTDVDVVVTEYALGWTDGVSMLRTVRDMHPGAAVLFLTRVDETATAVEALKSGASDYLVKGSRSYLDLPGAVAAAVERGQDRRIDDRSETGRPTPALDVGSVADAEPPKTEQVTSTEFALMTTHELQAPLRAMSHDLDTLAAVPRWRLPADAREAAKRAAAGVGRMQQLIDDLLALARVTGRERQLALCDCEQVVDAAIARVTADSGDSGARITRGALPTVNADPAQLSRVFENLISNALKFRADTPIEAHVWATAEAGQWLFAVRDNGVGIDRDGLQDIFGLFKRLRREYPGTGVGLAVCRRIVEGHGGRIWATSEPGSGSTFFFTLPRQAEAGVTASPGETSARGSRV